MPTIIDGVNGVNKVAPGTVTDTSLNTALEDTLVRTTEYPGYNYIINGNFDIWQRATSQTTFGYGSADRWSSNHSGTTKTHSMVQFVDGSIFPDGNTTPIYHSRTVVSSVTGVSNHAALLQRIENVRTCANKKATLSFYAKANANKNMSIQCEQNFGVGGSTSVTFKVQKVALTSTWQRFVISLDIPSVLGKTIGVANFIQLTFWLDAGTTFNAYTDTLGHQSGTFDITGVVFVEGDKDIKPIPRSYGEELALCQRYYEIGTIYQYLPPSQIINFQWFYSTKRAIPVVTQNIVLNQTATTYNSTQNISLNSATFVFNPTATQGPCTLATFADAEL